MSIVFILEENKQWFLDEHRIDPMTRECFVKGDRVVVCADCKTVFLESTWNDCGGCCLPGCSCTQTSDRFLRAPDPRPQAVLGTLNRIILRNGGVDRQPEPPLAGQAGNKPRMVILSRRSGG